MKTKPDTSADAALSSAVATPDTTEPTADNGKFARISLSEPIQRGDTALDTVTLRKPKAGELRGLSLEDVIGTDIGAILKLIPRISEPPLLDSECLDLDPADLTEMGGAIRGFFMTKAERAMMKKMMEDQQPTS